VTLRTILVSQRIRDSVFFPTPETVSAMAIDLLPSLIEDLSDLSLSELGDTKEVSTETGLSFNSSI
jgi:hypothetical protein